MTQLPTKFTTTTPPLVTVQELLEVAELREYVTTASASVEVAEITKAGEPNALEVIFVVALVKVRVWLRLPITMV
jgi:hypothetical protein